MDTADKRLVFIGTYTEPILFGTGEILPGKGQGIYCYRYDAAADSLELCSVNPAGPNPSYLTIHPSKRFLYAVNELKEFNGAPTGAVSAFSIDTASGSLTFLNRQPSHGTDPCHLAVDKTGKFLLVANFMSGSVGVMRILQDGSLGEATAVIQHQGSSVDPARQTGPHAHAVVFDASGRYVFVPDLGLDKLMIYRFDPGQGTLEPHDPAWLETPPGAGPRQIAMHPSGEYAYLINELNSTVTALRYHPGEGRLAVMQTISTLPEGFEGANSCAELQMAPSGRFLYGSNRGHDSIVSYAINPEDGTLSCTGHQSTLGKTPRHFLVDASGELLLVANQDTDTLIGFQLEPDSGKPVRTGQRHTVPTPVCVKIL